MMTAEDKNGSLFQRMLRYFTMAKETVNMIICILAKQDFLVVSEMAEIVAIVMDFKVRLEMIILISVNVQIGLSALMAMLMEIKHQVSRALRSCVIVDNS